MNDTRQPPETATLASQWMEWAASSSVFSSPLWDETGSTAGRKQPQHVWFLAGTTGESARREFAVPAGRSLFGPAFCMWHSQPIDGSDIASAFGTVRVDGLDVETVRAATGAVPIRGAVLNPITRVPWRVSMHMVGIWADIKPLAVGSHFVEIRGGDGFGFEVSVDATIHVS